MNKCAIIVSGGRIDSQFALGVLESKSWAYIIGADRGLSFLHHNQIMPTHIVGDFDSEAREVVDYYRDNTSVMIQEFNPVKDATDTEIALRLAIELGVTDVCILGATGTRMDHVLGNIQILKIAHDAGVKAYIVDEYNKISLIEKDLRLKKEEAFGDYFSLFPLGGEVENLTIEGAFYPLINHTLLPYDSLCVSNQFKEDEVRISFSEGLIILIESRD